MSLAAVAPRVRPVRRAIEHNLDLIVRLSVASAVGAQ
jgi:hypothetical protein